MQLLQANPEPPGHTLPNMFHGGTLIVLMHVGESVHYGIAFARSKKPQVSYQPLSHLTGQKLIFVIQSIISSQTAGIIVSP